MDSYNANLPGYSNTNSIGNNQSYNHSIKDEVQISEYQGHEVTYPYKDEQSSSVDDIFNSSMDFISEENQSSDIFRLKTTDKEINNLESESYDQAGQVSVHTDEYENAVEENVKATSSVIEAEITVSQMRGEADDLVKQVQDLAVKAGGKDAKLELAKHDKARGKIVDTINRMEQKLSKALVGDRPVLDLVDSMISEGLSKEEVRDFILGYIKRGEVTVDGIQLTEDDVEEFSNLIEILHDLKSALYTLDEKTATLENQKSETDNEVEKDEDYHSQYREVKTEGKASPKLAERVTKGDQKGQRSIKELALILLRAVNLQNIIESRAKERDQKKMEMADQIARDILAKEILKQEIVKQEIKNFMLHHEIIVQEQVSKSIGSFSQRLSNGNFLKFKRGKDKDFKATTA